MDLTRLWPFGVKQAAGSAPRADVGDGAVFYSLDDPLVREFLRDGLEAASGATVNTETALRNPAMFRAVSLISYAIGMLPLHVIDDETKEKADHPLSRILHREPNNWQTAFDFRSLMQLRALVKGNAYALIIRSRQIRTGRDEIVRLVPLNPDYVQPVQNDDWSVSYRYQPPKGAQRMLRPDEVFHLRGLSLDGISGMSLVKQARDAIGLALSAEMAAGRLFKNGSFIGGALTHPGKLSDPAFERLRASLAEKEGASNAGKNLILEEGMKWENLANNAKDAQLTELRKMQVEEIARVTGVPRPLLMVDETSWGSGIQALGQFFVQYALNPWFEAWQQAAERSLLASDEKGRLAVKFNPGALLRGSTKDQGDFFSKALGSGGAPGWLSQNEVRALDDRPPVDGGDEVSKGSQGQPPAPDNGGEDAPT
ncbi:phage portal protein [Brevundimonas vesicularis]|uniref:Phage portal protein n=1 Tax=Brevundimonas vesicularis TaxID=41276 RepID=A0A1Z3U5D9_BREVE|nr:phage portal protein [Brevundimonas vesicularis]ASE38465.1 phage portal protein [Brevundimonas vesicularis]